jgi:hypothetical protein
MTVQANPVIGAMVRKDGKLQPVEGSDPSAPGTYREAAVPPNPPPQGTP